MSGSRVTTCPTGVLGAKAVDGIVKQLIQEKIEHLIKSEGIVGPLICRIEANLEHEKQSLLNYQTQRAALEQALKVL